MVGTPIWVYSWRVIQDSLADPAEMGSTLRLGILYLLALGGVITVITTAAMVMNTLLTWLLGAGLDLPVFHPADRRTNLHWRTAWPGMGLLRILAQSSHRSCR